MAGTLGFRTSGARSLLHFLILLWFQQQLHCKAGSHFVSFCHCLSWLFNALYGTVGEKPPWQVALNWVLRPGGEALLQVHIRTWNIRVHPLKHASAWQCRIIGNHCDWNTALTTKVCDWKLTWIQIMYRLTRARRHGCHSVLRIKKNRDGLQVWILFGLTSKRQIILSRWRRYKQCSSCVCESMRHSCMLVPPNPYTGSMYMHCSLVIFGKELDNIQKSQSFIAIWAICVGKNWRCIATFMTIAGWISPGI